ncbi:MAG: hypothetical protein U5K00_11135 [Melioribacteraceae bacterium]|nr:hypothetical protein [Melioribacteraceae bacterium]
MKRLLILFISLLSLSMLVFSQEEGRLLRFPAIYEDQVVFTYAGDLYTVSADGGVARKLTNHVGVEIFPRFSNNGEWIAFTGQYDGNTEVYIMPSIGGKPERITYTATLGRDDVSDRMGPNNLVIGWTPDDKNVLFRSRMNEFNSFKGHLFLAPVDGNIHTQLPLPRGGFLHILLMGNSLHTTGFSVNSELGKNIEAEWPMKFPYMILKQKRQKQ